MASVGGAGRITGWLCGAGLSYMLLGAVGARAALSIATPVAPVTAEAALNRYARADTFAA
jgi:hypothetical protein